MYQVVKRDGKVVEFDINKIAAAIKKAFEATNTDYNDSARLSSLRAILS